MKRKPLKKRLQRRPVVEPDDRRAMVDLGDGVIYEVPAPVAIYIEDLYQEAYSLSTRIDRAVQIDIQDFGREPPKIKILR